MYTSFATVFISIAATTLPLTPLSENNEFLLLQFYGLLIINKTMQESTGYIFLHNVNQKITMQYLTLKCIMHSTNTTI